jgi:uncharacterized protein (TIGR02647 family)
VASTIKKRQENEFKPRIFRRSRATQPGLKIHHEAAPGRIAAGKRLYGKNIVTLEDGGFLTPLGVDAAEHAQALITMLRIKE